MPVSLSAAPWRLAPALFALLALPVPARPPLPIPPASPVEPSAASPELTALHTYGIDQRYGSIGFSIEQLGLFAADGTFRRFHGTLTLDPAHPDQSHIDVVVAAGSADMTSAQAEAMLRSPAYFDVAQFPDIRFVSTAISRQGPNRFVLRGRLSIRGVTRPETLTATLTREQPDPATHTKIADFAVSGTLKRSDFGMTANRNFVGNTVTLTITLKLTLLDAGG